MAWLIKRGRRYVVRWLDDQGRMQQASTGTGDKAAAQKIAQKITTQRALARHGLETHPEMRTVRECWDLFIAARRDNWTERTLRLYQWAGARLCAASVPEGVVGAIPATRLSADAIGQISARWRAERTLSDTSTAIWTRHVRTFVAWASERGWIHTQRISLPSVRRRAERVRIMTGAEIGRLLAACPDERARTLFCVMLLTGARIEHACSLRWEDINEAEGLLYLRAARAKGGKPHEIVLFGALRKLLQEYGQNRVRTGDLWGFGHWRARRLFEQARDAAGLADAITPHCLRHTAAAGWLMRGVPIYDVSRLLNHSSVTVTERHYGHLQRGRQLAWIEQSDVADLLKNVTDGV